MNDFRFRELPEGEELKSIMEIFYRLMGKRRKLTFKTIRNDKPTRTKKKISKSKKRNKS